MRLPPRWRTRRGSDLAALPAPDVAARWNLEVEARRLAQGLAPGLAASTRRGAGDEVERIRGYLVGDEARSVDWKVTARRGSLHVRESRQESERDVVVVVDRSASLFHRPAGAAAGTAVRTAAIVAEAAALRGHRVGLVVVTERVEGVLLPGTGRRHLARLRDALVTPVQGSGTRLSLGLDRAARHRGRNGLTVVISDFLPWRPDELRRPLAGLAARHEVIPVVVAAQPRSLPDVGCVRLRDPENGDARVVDTRRLEGALAPEPGVMRRYFATLGMDALILNASAPLGPQLRARWGRGGRA